MITNIETAKAKLKQALLDQQSNDETRQQIIKDLEDLQANELLQQTLKDLAKQAIIKEQEAKAKAAMTPEDYQREQALLSHLEDIRLIESLLAVAELELQQLKDNYTKSLESQELKVKNLSKKLQKLNNIINN